MSDDQGWAETGYYDHRLAQTPNLDAMAQSGLQLDRFYATAPICSPTRVSILTGRHHYRSGCFDVKDCTLDQQETTIAEVLQEAGYATGHFGKWHIGQLRGPNASSPGDNGFAQWVSAFLFFDLNADSFQENGQPLSAISGDGSDFIMSEALQFIEQSVNQEQPFFAVIWYAAPHMPWEALEADRALFSGSSEDEQNYFGELYAMDRSIGVLRQQLRELGVADNTILWFNSDNGPHRRLGSEATGGLRGYKSSLWEGGIRVPAVIEWPARIPQASVTAVPVSTLDIFPTLLAAAGIFDESTTPLDGINLLPLMDGTMTSQDNPIPFWYEPEIDTLPSPNIGHAVWLLDPYKLHKMVDEAGNATFQLYNIVDDPTESTDLAETHPDILAQMITALEVWQEDVWLDLEE
ncbi:MAG: sulfatase-like hydrolase/transferase [bacterium]|nr:sulfatase-like hydrolase/transferase [bacterium]